MSDLVSVIMPVYNIDRYISKAIDSLIYQSHENWELFIIDDGSSDATESICQGYTDPRIHYFKQNHAGVSAARNVGLKEMKGDYFCFLDGDDFFPPNSLASRLIIFQNNPNVSFVDGKVEKWNEDFTVKIGSWNPNFKGNPLSDLICLTGNSFFGPSWMIRVNRRANYSMEERLTHGEDLMFYIDVALSGGEYNYTRDTCLNYRVHNKSAMRNLDKLSIGYSEIESLLVNRGIEKRLIRCFRGKRKKIMFKSFLSSGRFVRGLKYLFLS